MAVAMKSWYVTVMEHPCKQVDQIKCVSAVSATEKLKAAKEKYVNIAPDPTSSDPRLKKGVTYMFFREQF
jgi:predicted SPOUT superfamily RNA methylase MTH1